MRKSARPTLGLLSTSFFTGLLLTRHSVYVYSRFGFFSIFLIIVVSKEQKFASTSPVGKWVLSTFGIVCNFVEEKNRNGTAEQR
jgi:hypothetical protein